MPRYGSADVGFLLVSGMNILGDITDLEDTPEALLEETTVLGVAWEEHAYIGVKRYMLTQEGFYNDAANRSNAALVAPGTSKVLSFAPEGNTLGKRCVSTPLVQAKYTRKLSRAALHKARAEYLGEGGHDEGIILHALGAETADGDTEGAGSQDAGALSSAGGGGVLQVTALTLGGYDDVVFTVRHSDDDSTYADLITFTAVTAAPAGERKTVTGTVNRHLAAGWAFSGSGSGPSVTAMVAFARG
jgi:hypothetical protein